MVHRGVNGGVAVLPFLKDDACTHEAGRGHDVDFVEGQPVLHLRCVTREHRLGKPHKTVEHGAAAPATVRRHQVHGDVVVVKRHHRLYPPLAADAENVVVEGKALLVGLRVVTVGEDAAPRDGEAQGLEPHLAEERDVLSIMMIEIDGLLSGVVMALIRFKHG